MPSGRDQPLWWTLRRPFRPLAARDLDQDTLDHKRRVLGEDHPSTLTSAHSLAADLYELGEVQAARDLAQGTLDRRRRVLGEDHTKTLASANNLAACSATFSAPWAMRMTTHEAVINATMTMPSLGQGLGLVPSS